MYRQLVHGIASVVVITILPSCTRVPPGPADKYVRCRTTEASKVTYVHEWKFDAVRTALIEEIGARPQGLLMRETLPAVIQHIPEDKRKLITSPKWLVNVVTNELKERREIAIEKRGDKYFLLLPPGKGEQSAAKTTSAKK